MGAEPPEEFLPPLVERVWLPYWKAYHALAGDRRWVSGGMGGAVPQRLPYLAKRRYARDWGFTDDDGLEDFLLVIDALDDVFLKWHEAERDRATKK